MPDEADLIQHISTLQREGAVVAAFEHLRPHIESSLTLRVHAGLAALRAELFGEAAEILRPALVRHAEIDADGAGHRRIPARAGLGVVCARADLGARPLSYLMSAEGREAVNDVLAAASDCPQLAPLKAALGLHSSFLSGRLSQGDAATIKALPSLIRNEAGRPPDPEVADLAMLCLPRDVTRDHLPCLGRILDFVADKPARQQREQKVREWRPEHHLGWRRFVMRRMLRTALGLFHRFSIHWGAVTARLCLEAMETAARSPRKARQLSPDPEGRDWQALESVAALYTLLAWRVPGASLEEIFFQSIKGEEILALYRLVALRRPSSALQVGTFAGFSAGVIGMALRDHAPTDCVFHLVDPDVAHGCFDSPLTVAEETLAALGPEVAGRMRYHRGWFATRPGFQAPLGSGRRGIGTAWEVPLIGHRLMSEMTGPIDFAFVDGDHSFSATLADTLLLLDHLAPGGMMAHHDIRPWPGIALMFETLKTDGWYLNPDDSSRESSMNAGAPRRGLTAVADVYEIYPNTCDGLGVIERHRDVSGS